MKRSTLLLLLLFLQGILTHALSQESQIQYLSGTDKDHTVTWEFNCTKGRNSGTWTNILVPSLWDQQGFGIASTGAASTKSSDQGMYRYSFAAPGNLQNKKVFLVFEGVMSDAEVKLNGKPAGDPHQGGFTQFSYDVTGLMQADGKNLLEVTVSKESAGADFISGGIYRPVYLKIVPEVYIERVAIDAKSNGSFTAQVYSHSAQPGNTVEVQIQDLNGKNVGTAFQAAATNLTELKKQFTIFKTWNPENPNQYQAVISLKDSTKVLHTIKQRFGFRTAELRDVGGFYVNGTRVLLKGINQRCVETGLLLTRERYIAAINMMKDMNMNAVRLSYYPADPLFLDLCDSMGLFVINELTNNQTSVDAPTEKRLIKELVARDVNHPSVVLWANASERLTGAEIDNEYRSSDPQLRLVVHSAAKANEADANKGGNFNDVANSILYGSENATPSEIANGLYNGGRAAGLEEFWIDMAKQPKFAGGFLASFRDDASQNDNGESELAKLKADKGSSYYAIKEIWSPLVFDANSVSSTFNGSLAVENRFTFTNLNKCKFEWKLLLFPKATEKKITPLVMNEGTAVAPFVAPGERGILKLTLPASSVATADALVLTVNDTKGRELYTWTFPVHKPADLIKTIPEVSSISTIIETEDENFLSLVTDGINYIFDKKAGGLIRVYCGKRDIPFTGPILAGLDAPLIQFKHYEKETSHIVEAVYKGDNYLYTKWIFQSGELPKLEYQYTVKSAVDYKGITFNYPEEKIIGMKWMGRGPFQAWRNRLKGQQLGIWEKVNKEGETTASAGKEEDVKGWHAETYWVQMQTAMGNFTIYTDQSNLFLQLFNPQQQAFANPAFPSNGNIGFMHSISGIGTKAPVEQTVSKSLKSVKEDQPMTGSLWFDFRF